MSEQSLPPMPSASEATRFFWDGAAQHRLLIMRCDTCGTYVHPPRPVCHGCLSTDLAPAQMSGRATLYTWTVVEQAFHPYYADKVPYVYATVELIEQRALRLITNIVDCPPADLQVGMPVEVTFRELSADLTVPLFRPV